MTETTISFESLLKVRRGAVDCCTSGPYAEEWPSIERLYRAITAADYQAYGRHHEIYRPRNTAAAPQRGTRISPRPAGGPGRGR